jgi:tetratricopeptide (TPR) repeat protein
MKRQHLKYVKKGSSKAKKEIIDGHEKTEELARFKYIFLVQNNPALIYKYLVEYSKIPIPLHKNLLLLEAIEIVVKRFIHEIALDKVGVLLFCARMLIKMNKTNKAKKLCLEILKNNINERDKIKIQALLGDIYYKKGDVNGAIEQYSSAIFLAEKTKNYDLASIAYHQVGVMFFKEGRIDLALGNISRSIKLCEKTERNYKLGESYYQLGKIYEKKEQWKLALRAYNKALIFKKKVEDKEHYDPSDIYYRMILISNKLSNSKNSTAKLSS